MTNIYQLIDRIKKRPGMYLGKPSIIRLKSFLDGYMGAREDLGFPLTEQEEKFNYFQEWIQTRFKITSSHSWADSILFYSADDKEALNQFFELFDQFIKIENSGFNSELKLTEQLTL
jgi:hypothetical protein